MQDLELDGVTKIVVKVKRPTNVGPCRNGPLPPFSHSRRSAGIALLESCCIALFLVAQAGSLTASESSGTAPPASSNEPTSASSSPQASLLSKVAFDQRLDHQLPLGLTFEDEHGEKKTLQSYFGERPVLLVLAYYRCPMLCTQVLNGVLKCTNAIDLTAGQEFDIVVVSFDPHDTPAAAAAKRDNYTERYLREDGRGGWHFLVGSQANIDALCRAVGFQYQYDAKSDQYAHASGIMLATPSGRLSRYFYGIDFSTRDLTLGLVEASAGRIGSPVYQVLLFCFHYDPLTGRYGVAIMRLLQTAGIATVLGLAGYIGIMLRRERRAQRVAARMSLLNATIENSKSSA